MESFRDVGVNLPHVAGRMVCRDALLIVNTDEPTHVLACHDGTNHALGMLALHVEVQMVAAVEAASPMEFVSFHALRLLLTPVNTSHYDFNTKVKKVSVLLSNFAD